jgi:hypothetical protein
MTRTVLTAGLLSVAALGLGIVSAQAAPAAPQLSGLTNQASNTVEKAHWRDGRWYRYQRHYYHRRHHHHRRWWW